MSEDAVKSQVDKRLKELGLLEKEDEEETDEEKSEDHEEEKTEKNESGDFTYTFEITKTDEDRQLVGGIIFKSDRPDLDNDIPSSPRVVEDALHDFMLKSQQAGLAHMVASDDVKFVELWTAKTDFDWNGTDVHEGDALGVAKIFNDELWTITKDKELFNGFSVEGKAVRPVEDE